MPFPVTREKIVPAQGPSGPEYKILDTSVFILVNELESSWKVQWLGLGSKKLNHVAANRATVPDAALEKEREREKKRKEIGTNLCPLITVHWEERKHNALL